jgi:hypothetical protein
VPRSRTETRSLSRLCRIALDAGDRDLAWHEIVDQFLPVRGLEFLQKVLHVAVGEKFS